MTLFRIIILCLECAIIMLKKIKKEKGEEAENKRFLKLIV